MFGQRACSGVPLLYWSFKCSLELLHLRRCFLHNTKYPTTHPHRQTNPPHHAPAGIIQPFSPTAPTNPTHPHIQRCLTFVRDELGYESSGKRAPFCLGQNSKMFGESSLFQEKNEISSNRSILTDHRRFCPMSKMFLKIPAIYEM